MWEKTKKVSIQELLQYALERDWEKIPALDKIFTPSEIERIDTSTADSFYLSLCRVIGEREGWEDVEAVIHEWIDFYYFLVRVRFELSKGEDKNLRSRKIQAASCAAKNIADSRLREDIRKCLEEASDENKLKGMHELLFYQLGKKWNSIFLSLVEIRAMERIEKEKMRTDPISALLQKWQTLGKDIGMGGKVNEMDFQKKKMDIVYYTAYICRFLSAPQEIKNNVMIGLTWFVSDHDVKNAPSFRIGSLTKEWAKVLLEIEMFWAEKKLSESDRKKEVVVCLEELLPLWSELEELVKKGSFNADDEKRFTLLRRKLLISYSQVGPKIDDKFILDKRRKNLVSYVCLSEIEKSSIQRKLVKEWHNHYLELHQVLDDFLLKEGGLDFNAMRESLSALLESWEELGNFLTGSAGNPDKIKKKVYRQFKAAKKAAPILSGEGAKIMNLLASLTSKKKTKIITKWDEIFMDLYSCYGEVEALEVKYRYEQEDEKYKSGLYNQKTRKKLGIAALLIVLFLSVSVYIYKQHIEHQQFMEKLTYRPWQKEPAATSCSFKRLAKESVLDMVKDTDRIWVLRKDGRLKIYQLGTGREETIPIHGEAQFKCLHVDSNFVWVGADKGILRMDKLSRTWTDLTGEKGIKCKNITAITSIESVLWIGTSEGKDWKGGVVSYNIPTEETNHYTKEDGLCGNDVTALAVIEDEIWAGTKAGIGIYDKEKGKWRGVEDRKFETINCIALDESFVWMGSLGKVYVFDMKEKVWKNCPIKEGL